MRRFRCILLALFSLLLLTACGEQEEGRFTATLITTGEHVIHPGETLEGMLLLVEGNLRVEENARVDGSIYMLAGTLQVEGEVTGDLSILGGELVLGPRATVAGRLNVGGGTVERSPTATIGELVESDVETLMGRELAAPERPLGDRVRWFLFETMGLAALAAVLARLIPRPLSRVAQAIAEEPLATGAYGILVGIVVPALLVIMAFTLILIPLTTVGFLFLAVAAVYGLCAFGLIAGRFVVKVGRWAWSVPVQAFLGTLLFMALMNVLEIVPLVGGLLPLLLAAVGLGAVLLTHFGRRHFVAATEVVVAEREALRRSATSGGQPRLLEHD